MTTGEIITLLGARGYVFNRALGQHFLTDEDILQRIIGGSGVGADTDVLEIGPGAGVLTQPLSQAARRVLAVELDRGLMPVLATVLERRHNVRVVREDIMRCDIAALTREAFGGGGEAAPRFSVVSNLPYSITTPVLTRLLDGTLPIDSMTVMVQREAAERVMAREGKAYGPLAISAGYRTRVAKILDVPRDRFIPQPNVDSVVLRMDFAPPEQAARDEKAFFELARLAFAQRRKTLRNNLRALGLTDGALAELFEECGVDAKARAEQVSLAQFVRMANCLQLLSGTDHAES